MAKMTDTQKLQRKALLRELREELKGEVFSVPAFGMVIAVCPSIGDTSRARFVRVAVAQCSASDKFKRKHGELIATKRLMYAEGLSVPVKGRTLEEIADSVAAVLRGV